MKVTTDHPASSYGQPVILDDAGNPLDYSPGVRAVRERLGLTRAQLAEACGVSARTVEGWEAPGPSRPPEAAALNVMGDLLRRARRRGKP